MSDTPAFARCPYCSRKLDKRPLRKSKCPHCGEPIYVRGDDLLREDELAKPAAKPKKKPASHSASAASKPAAKKKTSKKETTTGKANKKSSKESTAAAPRKRRKPKQNKLEIDLLSNAREVFRRLDLEGGIKLILQLLGALLGGNQLFEMLGGLMQGKPARSAFEAVDMNDLVARVGATYESVTQDEQRQLRAAVTWLQNGFDLGDRLAE